MKTQINIRLSSQLRRRLDEEAKKSGLGTSEIMRAALDQYLRDKEEVVTAMPKMKAHWVQVVYEHGELNSDAGGADLYLTEVREWYSKDGIRWEEQPSRWEMYTGGTVDALSTHTTEEEAIAAYASNHPGLELECYNTEPARVIKWSVDDAGGRCGFMAATMPEVE